jgi:hypothetical protein
MTGEAWFRPRRFGYGATPINAKGWIFVTAMLVAMFALGAFISPGAGRTAVTLVWLFALIVVCRAKTDGSWHWSWGGATRRSDK